ncbi:Mycolipanoate synthase [Microsporum ferrugineum]
MVDFYFHELQPGMSVLPELANTLQYQDSLGILMEGVLSTNYITGLLSDWQTSEEEDRLEQPYLSPERWDQELRAAGFTGNETIGYDFDMPNQTAFTILSSLAPTLISRNDITLLADDSPSPWAKELASNLCEQGYNVHWGSLNQAPPANHCIVSLLDLDGPYLHTVSEQRYSALHTYLMEMDNSKMMWVTKTSQLTCGDPRFELIFGLARTLRQEMALDISTFETDIFDSVALNALIDVLTKVEKSRAFSENVLEYEFSFRCGTIYTGRCHWASPQSQMPIEPLKEQPRKLEIGSLGSVDTLRWAPFDAEELTGTDVEIDMHYLGLNFRDVMVAMGLFGNPEEFGIEGSGVVRQVAPGATGIKPGDRVFVLATGAFRSRVVKPAHMVTHTPDDITLEDAATMPCVYFTTILCLETLAPVKEGEIFATVGTEEKVQYLMDHFDIPRHRIFNSRSADFLSNVMRETNGRGVDVVLNSLAGKLLHASWQTSRRYRWWYDQKRISPIRPVKVYDAAEVVDAYRYMQQGSHMGKILIRIPQDFTASPFTGVKAPIVFSPDVSYLLVGGLGGLGRSISSWMVEQGARYLAFMQELKDQGCHAVCIAGSVVDLADVKSAIAQCPRPVSGVIQLSTVLKDCTFSKMSYEEWETCLETKVQGTWNLHNALTNEKLDFFVSFGSVSGVCGNIGQANYAAANGFLTSFTQYRRRLGLPASVLELGMVDEVSMASNNEAALQNARSSSLRLVYEDELIEGLRLAIHQCRRPPSPDSMMSSSCIIGLGNTKPLSDPGVRPLWSRDARFALYSNIESKGVGTGQTVNNEIKILLSRIGQNPAYLKSPESKAMIFRAMGNMIM